VLCVCVRAYVIFRRYVDGSVVERDYDKAFTLYQMSAMKGFMTVGYLSSSPVWRVVVVV